MEGVGGWEMICILRLAHIKEANAFAKSLNAGANYDLLIYTRYS